MKTWGLAVATAAMLAATAPATAAPMIGDTVTCTASAFGCSTGKAIIGSGTEFTDGLGFAKPLLSFDFSSGFLKISNLSGFDYGIAGRLKYSFQDLSHAFTEVTLMSDSGFSGIGQANFAITEGVLSFASSSFSARKGAEMTLRLSTAGAVPEAATWAMMILGLAAVGAGLRRNRGDRTLATA